MGIAPPVPAWFAQILRDQVRNLPHFGAQGCRVLGITPTDMVGGTVIDPAPPDFNPRPTTSPGIPATTAGWQ